MSIDNKNVKTLNVCFYVCHLSTVVYYELYNAWCGIRQGELVYNNSQGECLFLSELPLYI